MNEQGTHFSAIPVTHQHRHLIVCLPSSLLHRRITSLTLDWTLFVHTQLSCDHAGYSQLPLGPICTAKLCDSRSKTNQQPILLGISSSVIHQTAVEVQNGTMRVFGLKKTLVFTPLQTTFLTVLLSQKIFFVSMQSFFTSRANQKTFFSCINCMALISVQDYVCHVPTRAAAVKSGWASVKFHLRLPYKQGWSVSLTITPMLDSGNMCSCSHVTVLWLSESNWRLKKWGSVMTGRKVVKYL